MVSSFIFTSYQEGNKILKVGLLVFLVAFFASAYSTNPTLAEFCIKPFLIGMEQGGEKGYT